MQILPFYRPLAIAACATLLAATATRAQFTLYEDNETAGTVNTVDATGTLTFFKTISAGDDLKALAFDSHNNLFVGDRTDGTIRKVTPGRVESTFVSLPNDSINYLITGAGDNLFASEGANAQILKITPAGVVSTYATLPKFADPEGIAFDVNGNLFAATQRPDTLAAVVYKITPAGVVSALAKLPNNCEPNGLVLDANGNVYVAETLGGRIVKITPAGVVSTFATLAANEGPVTLAMDAAGNLYTTLSEDTRIQKISSTGVESAFASDQGTPGRIVFGPAVMQAPVITSATKATATQSTAFSYQITATGSPTSFGVQGLPAGLTINAKTGLISGTSGGVGKVTLTLNAYNAAGKGSTTLTLTINATPPVVTSASTASGKVGTAFSYQITASNQPTSFGVQGLPSGLAVDAKTGLISGTPKVAGKFTLTLNAYNGAGKGSATLTLTITPL